MNYIVNNIFTIVPIVILGFIFLAVFLFLFLTSGFAFDNPNAGFGTVIIVFIVLAIIAAIMVGILYAVYRLGTKGYLALVWVIVLAIFSAVFGFYKIRSDTNPN